MPKKYDTTYKFGQTTVHIVAPPPMTKDDVDRVLAENRAAIWGCWNTLTAEEKIKANSEWEKDGLPGTG